MWKAAAQKARKDEEKRKSKLWEKTLTRAENVSDLENDSEPIN